MSSGDRRRQQTALHTVANPPAPLLLLPASQSLTFSADDVQLPGMLMPMPQAAANDQLVVGNTCCSVISLALLPLSRFAPWLIRLLDNSPSGSFACWLVRHLGCLPSHIGRFATIPVL